MSRVLATRQLVAHPAAADDGLSVGVRLSSLGQGALKLEFAVVGPIADLAVPAESPAERRDNLWQTTCFEAFFGAADGTAYREFNVSPSCQWASYHFADYRADMMPDRAFEIEIYREEVTRQRLAVTAIIVPQGADIPLIAGASARIGLSAVIERKYGGKSYWALAHPSDIPDFHHPACFTLKLD